MTYSGTGLRCVYSKGVDFPLPSCKAWFNLGYDLKSTFGLRYNPKRHIPKSCIVT